MHDACSHGGPGTSRHLICQGQYGSEDRRGGALNGITSGSQCAQVTAVRTATTGSTAQQWGNISVIGTPTGSEACVRGHIPLSLNSDVGGLLGRFTQAQRLIDNDQYWLSVTS
jgi:hypothetical protein